MRGGRDNRFLRECLRIAQHSPDPNTKVGAILARGEYQITASFNHFPRGLRLTEERLADREVKNALMLHAEQAVIVQAATCGVATRDSTLYIVATDDSGEVWGGPPCATHCLPVVLGAYIAEIVTYPFKTGPSKWAAEVARSRELLAEAGIIYREVTP